MITLLMLITPIISSQTIDLDTDNTIDLGTIIYNHSTPTTKQITLTNQTIDLSLTLLSSETNITGLSIIANIHNNQTNISTLLFQANHVSSPPYYFDKTTPKQTIYQGNDQRIYIISVDYSNLALPENPIPLLLQHVDNLTDDLQQKQDMVIQLNNDLNDTILQLEQNQSELQNKTDQLQDVNSQLDTIETQLISIQLDLNNSNNNYNNLTGDYDSLLNEKISLIQQRENLTENISRLENNSRYNKLEIANMSSDVSHYKHIYNQTRQTLYGVYDSQQEIDTLYRMGTLNTLKAGVYGAYLQQKTNTEDTKNTSIILFIMIIIVFAFILYFIYTQRQPQASMTALERDEQYSEKQYFIDNIVSHGKTFVNRILKRDNEPASYDEHDYQTPRKNVEETVTKNYVSNEKIDKIIQQQKNHDQRITLIDISIEEIQKKTGENKQEIQQNATDIRSLEEKIDETLKTKQSKKKQ